nr:tpr repeat protein oca3 [Quercus suber]
MSRRSRRIRCSCSMTPMAFICRGQTAPTSRHAMREDAAAEAQRSCEVRNRMSLQACLVVRGVGRCRSLQHSTTTLASSTVESISRRRLKTHLLVRRADYKIYCRSFSLQDMRVPSQPLCRPAVAQVPGVSISPPAGTDTYQRRLSLGLHSYVEQWRECVNGAHGMRDPGRQDDQGYANACEPLSTWRIPKSREVKWELYVDQKSIDASGFKATNLRELRRPLVELQSTSPEQALALSQKAPAFFSSQSTWSLPYPLNLLVNNESQEKWTSYENIFLACLRTGDNRSARICLEELTDRFGKQNERVLALTGLYKEATAQTDAELASVLSWYEDILREEPATFSLRKRRVALLKSMGRTADAITALTTLLDASPTDAEAWAELSDLYLSQGLYEQALFCLEEVLIVTPNAWNMHARIGEVQYLAAQKAEGTERSKGLAESMRRFCRSVELCDDYLRGYYGMKLVSVIPLQSLWARSSDTVTGDLAAPSHNVIQKLNELATTKLAEILRRNASGEKDWDGYSQPELAAARELLDKDTVKAAR